MLSLIKERGNVSVHVWASLRSINIVVDDQVQEVLLELSLKSHAIPKNFGIHHVDIQQWS